MEVRLRVLSGKNAGQEVPVGGPTFIIGRAEGCHLRPRSDQIGQQHCAIDVQPAQAVVRDLASGKGTYVNDELLTGPYVLKTGDRLRVGPLEFEAQVKIGLASKKKPKVGSVEEAAARLASGGRRDVDVSQWLEGGPTNDAVASRYAAAMSDEEKEQLGLVADDSTADASAGKPEEKPSQKPAAQGPNAPQDIAANALSKYFKRR